MHAIASRNEAAWLDGDSVTFRDLHRTFIEHLPERLLRPT